MRFFARGIHWYFAIVILSISTFSHAQGSGSFPNKPIKIIVPLAPGGGTDIAARILAAALSEVVGESVFVENKTGASGNIGMTAVAQSAPDGYTLLMGNVSTNAINEFIYAKQLKVSPSQDLVPITMIASIPNIIVSGPNFPPNNLKELVAYAKQRPGELNFSAPLGGYSNLDMLDFNRQAGISMVNIPSKGAGSSQTSIIAGEIHFSILNAATVTEIIKSGRMKAFATTSATRLPAFPDLPTMIESGYVGIGSDNWNAIFVPAKTPKPVVDYLFAAITKAMQNPKVKESFAKAYLPIVLSKSPEDARNFVRNDSLRWKRVISENNFSID
jgi:tripartite-type tricarboxylate transporter receptor subunit TctC